MKRFIIFSLLVFCASTLLAQNVNLKKLDTYYSELVEEWDVPSMSVAIVKDGKILFQKGYGVAKEGSELSVDEHTNYAIASNSKAMTTFVMAQLVEEGIVSWDDPVQKHLPYFKLYDEYTSAHTTVRDLLCHRVGLGTFSGDFIWYKSDLTAEEIIRRIQFVPQTSEFRTAFGYSNLMYITAGELIKTATGKSWNENIQERVFNAVEMERSLTHINKLESKGNYATPHARSNGKNLPIQWENWGDAVGATGGVISNVNDMANWMIMNLENGVWKDEKLISSASRNQLWKTHVSHGVNRMNDNTFERHFNGYGLGWGLSDFYGNLMVSHTGGYDGMLSAVSLIPDENLGIVVLTNGMQSPMMAATYYTLELFTEGEASREWSESMLARTVQNAKKDERIEAIKASKVEGTKTSIPFKRFTGTYVADMYGEIQVTEVSGGLRLEFSRSKDLGATLKHWHYNTFELVWDQPHAWFTFGTIQFELDNKLNITGAQFDVPNNDIFFDELDVKRVGK